MESEILVTLSNQHLRSRSAALLHFQALLSIPSKWRTYADKGVEIQSWLTVPNGRDSFLLRNATYRVLTKT